MRPLELPTCTQRLFGASVAEIAGPAVEPGSHRTRRSSEAATAGTASMPCSNTSMLRRTPTPRRAATLVIWQKVFGPAGPGLRQAATAAWAPATKGSPAVLFADQSKAFERLSHVWLARVLRGWKMPVGYAPHLSRWRSTEARALASLESPRHLRRGTGLGGTASPRLSLVAYDPVAHSLTTTHCFRAPTFVDDLSALTRARTTLALP